VTSDGDEPKPRVIYDTGVILQATLSPFGIGERALVQAENGMVDAVMSNRLRSEYEDVLRRLALLDKYRMLLRDEDIAVQLERIDATIVLVPNPPLQIVYPRDPNDTDTINLAVFYDVHFLVARDKDLLALNHDPVFQKRSPQARIVTPVEFVQEMERRRESHETQDSVGSW
jgi:putative PIN family toxin of toxin-antitoxin system